MNVTKEKIEKGGDYEKKREEVKVRTKKPKGLEEEVTGWEEEMAMKEKEEEEAKVEKKDD